MKRKYMLASGTVVLTALWVMGAHAQILKKEPGPGTLPAGAVALVDDGTCPRGQIKQVTGGNDNRGVPRQKKCIPKPN